VTEQPARKRVFTDDEYDLLVFLEQVWLTKGGLPSVAELVELGWEASTVKNAITKPAFINHCEEKGIPLEDWTAASGTEQAVSVAVAVPGGRKLAKDGKRFTLTPVQLATANAMLDLQDTRSQKKKLQDLDVSTQKYNAWLRDPIFQDYLRSRAEALLGDSMSEAHTALIDRVRSGDINAIKFYYEMTGRFTPARAGASNVDIMSLMNLFIEVIQRHVPDPDIQVRISDDLLSIARAGTFAQSIDNVVNAATVNGVPVIATEQNVPQTVSPAPQPVTILVGESND
jgi:hypothetical protein